MSKLFLPISARPDFGTLKPNTYASDYIYSKKARLTACNQLQSIYCKRNLTQGDLLLFKGGTRKRFIGNNNLIAGLYNKEELASVVSICNVRPAINLVSSCIPSTNININNVPFYSYYTIDPNGALFGNTPCGLHNFINYMVYNPPSC